MLLSNAFLLTNMPLTEFKITSWSKANESERVRSGKKEVRWVGMEKRKGKKWWARFIVSLETYGGPVLHAPLCELLTDQTIIQIDEFTTQSSRCQVASPQQGDLRLSGPPLGQGVGAGLEPATEGSLQICGRTRLPLCHRRLTRYNRLVTET
ncbi:hypothetical protein PoB_001952700 [Plakobranchus ocellatus]|uniref:Uncharacterized protein n=1 Tax=Plakobranchus ocellatus TaxID=259542 RepID=A0AAV3ZER8_9GAST|nr:hypothetical protein PoB_001952700 [Plakobranchus ocellatus]